MCVCGAAAARNDPGLARDIAPTPKRRIARAAVDGVTTTPGAAAVAAALRFESHRVLSRAACPLPVPSHNAGVLQHDHDAAGLRHGVARARVPG